MAVFDINGKQLQTVHSVDGVVLEQAYDINGNPLLDASYDLTVMTYNVQRFGGRNANQEMQEKILNTYNPDIVGLQELGGGMPSLGTILFADYPYQVVGNESNKAGIVSKIEFTNPTFKAYKQKSGETRGYEKAYITVNGKKIALFNTHIETIESNYSVHVAQVAELFGEMQKEECFIAIGDYNAELHSESDDEYADVVEPFINANYNMANWNGEFVDTWFNGTTVSGSSWKCPCDNIITSQNISIDEVIFDSIKLEYVSGAIDHIATVAYLKVN